MPCQTYQFSSSTFGFTLEPFNLDFSFRQQPEFPIYRHNLPTTHYLPEFYPRQQIYQPQWTPNLPIKRERDSDIEPVTTKKTRSSYAELEGHKCAVCDGNASGFHYGAYCCEACKVFFSRTAKNRRKRKMEICSLKQCVVSLQTRSHCPECRLLKCIAVGMSPAGRSRFGRPRRTYQSSSI